MAGNGQIVRGKIKLWQDDEARYSTAWSGKCCVRRFVEAAVTTE